MSTTPAGFSFRRTLSSALVIAMAVQCFAATGARAQGADGVELEIVPVDAGVDCSSIILKGTRRFEGTAFVMPRVVVGVTKENRDLFEIVADGKGGYLLSMGLYFPASNENFAVQSERSNLLLRGCNFETALHQINKDIPDAKPKVSRLARLPVRNIEVVIDGIKSRAMIGEVAQEGSDGTSILNYEGSDHTVEFNLTADEKDGLMRRLEREQGISIKVNMKFSARSNDGSLFAEVDLDSLAQNLEVGLKGRYLVASADLKLAIGRSLANTKINISTEAGKSQMYERIAENLVTMILSNVSDAGDDSGGKSPPSAPAKPAAPGTPATPAPTPAKPASASTDDSDSGDAGGPMNVRVDAVISLLHSQKKRVVNYSNVGELETHVYTTPVNFQARLQDPDIHAIYLRSGGRAELVPGQIRAGDHMTIAIAKAYVENIEYIPTANYLTADQITKMRIADEYPFIVDERFVLHNEDTKQGYFAVGKIKLPAFMNWRENIGLDPFKPRRLMWLHTDWSQSYHKPSQVRMEPSLDKWSGLSLEASFTKVGVRAFGITDLVQDNAYWSATFDEVGGKIELVAKRDLGYLSLIGRAPVRMEKRIVEQVQLETRTPGKQSVRDEPKQIVWKNVATQRLTYLLYVGRPDAKESHQSVTPTTPAVSTAPVSFSQP